MGVLAADSAPPPCSAATSSCSNTRGAPSRASCRNGKRFSTARTSASRSTATACSSLAGSGSTTSSPPTFRRWHAECAEVRGALRCDRTDEPQEAFRSEVEEGGSSPSARRARRGTRRATASPSPMASPNTWLIGGTSTPWGPRTAWARRSRRSGARRRGALPLAPSRRGCARNTPLEAAAVSRQLKRRGGGQAHPGLPRLPRGAPPPGARPPAPARHAAGPRAGPLALHQPDIPAGTQHREAPRRHGGRGRHNVKAAWKRSARRPQPQQDEPSGSPAPGSPSRSTTGRGPGLHRGPLAARQARREPPDREPGLPVLLLRALQGRPVPDRAGAAPDGGQQAQAHRRPHPSGGHPRQEGGRSGLRQNDKGDGSSRDEQTPLGKGGHRQAQALLERHPTVHHPAGGRRSRGPKFRIIDDPRKNSNYAAAARERRIPMASTDRS